MPRIKTWFLGIAVLLLLLLITPYFFLGSIIKAGIKSVGPKVTKTAVDVSLVTLSPFTGSGRIRGLVIGNPAGFKSESAVKLKNFRISLNPTSLASDVIHVRSVLIEAPEITKEGANLETIQRNVQSFVPAESGRKGEKSSSTKVVIDDLWLKEAKVHLELLGQMNTISIPDIHLTDIGKKSGGVTPAHVVDLLLGRVLLGVATGATDLGRSVSGSAQRIGSRLKTLFRKK
ncbi:MAG TPA: hypothetical protein VI895_01095 [Bdellovibrionota bacterium]|nr:hypothetical protein [Bdellovibrionota bacterium]